MNKVLVTGANGFVGSHLCNLLATHGYPVIGVTRSNGAGSKPSNYELRAVGDISARVNWGPVLDGVDVVVHLAARVHVMRDQESDPIAAFRRANVRGTEQLLRHDQMQNVKRLIYVSTVKVHGDETHDAPFSAADLTAPCGAYAQSKLEAEQLVEAIGVEVGFETTIIRPPLVYGAGAGGNFVRLLAMVEKGIPLPFAWVNNSRSLVNVENLCDLIRECLANKSASGGRFLVSDNFDVSTPKLIRVIATSMSRSARLVPVPVAMLRVAAGLLGRSAEVSRLIGSLQVDVSETMNTLNWQPPKSLQDGIQSTADWFRKFRAHE